MREPSSDIFVSLVICREILTDSHELPTAFGIINEVIATPSIVNFTFPDGGKTPVQMFNPAPVSALVSFHSELSQNVAVSLMLRRPDGEVFASEENPERKLQIEGGEKGAIFKISIPFQTANAGLFWFEVYVDRVLKNKTPLAVIHEPEAQVIEVAVPMPTGPAAEPLP